MKPHLLIIPGLGDSGENHWQSYWLKKFTNATKVIQDNWDEPKLEQWLEKLNEAIQKLDSPTILVAHSLAVSLVQHWAAKNSNPNIIGALLVAPADVNSPDHTPESIRNFAPIPIAKLHFPSIVVTSENDPYVSAERAEYLAKMWGSDFVNIGQKGHINSDSNLEYWEEGQLFLQQLMKKTNNTIMTNPIVSAAWLHKHLNDPELIVLEARLEQNQSNLENKLQDLQIKSARLFDIKNNFSDTNNPLPNTFPSAEKFTVECQKLGINQNSKIVVYDTLGIYSSPRAWWMFKTMGHSNIFVLDGGLPEWIKEGYPTEIRQETSYSIGNFEAKLQPEFIKNKEQILENINTKEAVLIDARSKDRFYATNEEPRAGLRSGHIPGSVNVPFTELQKDGKYKSKEELSKILKLNDKPLLFTCGSGITACIVLLACELISENPKAIYDGSWTEWGQTLALPIEK